MTTYFDHLAARLRGEGVPDDQVGVIVADLATYLDDTGVQPDAEFGPVAEFAAQLAPPRGDGVPAQPPDGETWRWRADAFDEMRWLETFGDQGWEV